MPGLLEPGREGTREAMPALEDRASPALPPEFPGCLAWYLACRTLLLVGGLSALGAVIWWRYLVGMLRWLPPYQELSDPFSLGVPAGILALSLVATAIPVGFAWLGVAAAASPTGRTGIREIEAWLVAQEPHLPLAAPRDPAPWRLRFMLVAAYLAGATASALTLHCGSPAELLPIGDPTLACGAYLGWMLVAGVVAWAVPLGAVSGVLLLLGVWQHHVFFSLTWGIGWAPYRWPLNLVTLAASVPLAVVLAWRRRRELVRLRLAGSLHEEFRTRRLRVLSAILALVAMLTWDARARWRSVVLQAWAHPAEDSREDSMGCGSCLLVPRSFLETRRARLERLVRWGLTSPSVLLGLAEVHRSLGRLDEAWEAESQAESQQASLPVALRNRFDLQSEAWIQSLRMWQLSMRAPATGWEPRGPALEEFRRGLGRISFECPVWGYTFECRILAGARHLRAAHALEPEAPGPRLALATLACTAATPEVAVRILGLDSRGDPEPPREQVARWLDRELGAIQDPRWRPAGVSLRRVLPRQRYQEILQRLVRSFAAAGSLENRRADLEELRGGLRLGAFRLLPLVSEPARGAVDLQEWWGGWQEVPPPPVGLEQASPVEQWAWLETHVDADRSGDRVLAWQLVLAARGWTVRGAPLPAYSPSASTKGKVRTAPWCWTWNQAL